MISECSPCSRDLQSVAANLGFFRVGVAQAAPVDMEAADSYHRWIDSGLNASMDYLAKYGDVRDDPRNLLEGAKSLIVCAMSYYHPSPGYEGGIAMYARGDDYHEIVRERLLTLATFIRETWGGMTRVCVDTAPIRERYWASKAGIGFIGVNHQLIIPGAGSWFFLGEIISTVEFVADKPLRERCAGCQRCVDACPGHAIRPDGTLDASRCLSYLTIENRGPISPGTDLHGNLYGCDICQNVCPHNASPVESPVSQFKIREEYLTLTPEEVATMQQDRFSALFRHSAIKRAKLEGLRRNALILIGASNR